MEGFVNLKIKPWLRRLITRSLAIIPSWGILHFFGEENTMDMLVFSQVVLSLQLGFAVFPLVYFTSNRVIMGKHVNPRWLKAALYTIALIILFFNLCLFL
jgi:manganese transport protein